MKTKTPFLNRLAALFLLVALATIHSCKKDNEQQPAPMIDSFSPASGTEPSGATVGTTVTITGSNFSTTPTDNVLKFNGTSATITSATKNELVTSVPNGATTGKLTLTVQNKTATSTNDFIVIPLPAITDFSPTLGPPGRTITINGSHFNASAGGTMVKFNNTVATITAATTTQLVVTVPQGSTTGKISVTVNTITVQSNAEFTVLPSTVISSFTPSSGVAGSSVTITGENFLASASQNIVKFSGQSASVTSASPTQLVATVPQGAATGKISVTVYDVVTTSANDFVVPSSPAISSFSPAAGIVGTAVTILGNNFSNDIASNVVKFNGTIATITTASTTQLIVNVPIGATTGKISVTANGLMATTENDFAVTPPMTILSFDPTSGPAGTQVTIQVQYANSPTGPNTQIKFNGENATLVDINGEYFFATVPSAATTGKISVTVNGQTATSINDFTVTQAPTIISFSPTSGQVSSTVTITGTNFSTTATENTVKFNNTTATVTSASSTQLEVSVPAGATTGKISVTVNGFTATSTTDFTLIQPPTITSFSPTSGAVGSTVIITGTNFSPTAANNSVKFNNTTAVVTSASSTQLEVSVPANATTGKISVMVNGLTATSINDFTLIQPPTITSFSPTSGTAGSTVIITGTNFNSTATNNVVKFNNTTAAVTSASSTQLEVSVPANATTGKISVTVNGLTVNSIDDFTVSQVPTITSFSPAYGLPDEMVTIQLAGFPTFSGLVVKFNGVNAVVDQFNQTEVKVQVPVGATSGKITIEAASQTVTSTTDFDVLKDIPRNGLVAFYPFTGNANDATADPANGVGGILLSSDRFGKNNQSSFSVINMGNPNKLQIANEITISAWIFFPSSFPNPNPTPNPPRAEGSIISKLDVNTGYSLEWLEIPDPNPNLTQFQIKFKTRSNKIDRAFFWGAIIIPQWDFISVTLNGSDLKVYLNGQLVGNTSNQQALTNGSAGDFLVGEFFIQNPNFNITPILDDVAIYNRALSPSEITQLYQQTISKY
jgi:Concanavalin A-like lectin/glucanases superfamily/IPT/TIG domain